jgi:hypothetical protein
MFLQIAMHHKTGSGQACPAYPVQAQSPGAAVVGRGHPAAQQGYRVKTLAMQAL